MEANLGDFPPLAPVVSRQSLGRLRARLQSVPSPENEGPVRGWMMREINKAVLFTTRPDRGEINRRDTRGGQA